MATKGESEEELFPGMEEDPHLSATEQQQQQQDEEVEEKNPVSFTTYSDSSDSSDDGYERGLPGTTPPSGGRYWKTTRRGHKYKATKKHQSLLGQVPLRHPSRQLYSTSRVKSAEWSLPTDEIDAEVKSPRRHTLPTVAEVDHFNWPPLTSTETAGLVDARGKKRKQDKDRQKERNDKTALHDNPLLSESPPHSNLLPVSNPQQSTNPLPSTLPLQPPSSLLSTAATGDSSVHPLSFSSPSIAHTLPTPTQSYSSVFPVSPLTSPISLPSKPPPHLRPLKNSFSLSDDIESTQSLSAAHLQVLSGERTETATQSKIERSHSDAQLSLTISSSQSMHCPPDRKQFFRNFSKKLALIAKRQQQSAPMQHIPRQHSENLSAMNPFSQMNEQLWLELRAWLAKRSVDEQEEYDYHVHRDVGKIIRRITKYRFSPSPQQAMENCFHGMDDYEPIMSLPARLNEANQMTREETAKTNEEQTPLSSINRNTVVRWEDGAADDEEEEDGPRTLTQQASNDSDSSSVVASEFTPGQFLSDDQQCALQEVNDILQELEKVELMYPSSGKFGDENSQYYQLAFRRRREGLVLWWKITDGLASHLARLSKWFGVSINPVTRGQESVSGDTSSEPSRHGSNGSYGYTTVPSSDVNPEESLSLMSLSLTSSLMFQTQSSIFSTSSSHSRSTLQRLFSSRNVLSIDEERPFSKGYRRFVDRVLKKKGLEWLIDELIKFVTPILECAEDAMKYQEGKVEDNDSGQDEAERQPLLRRYLPSEKTGSMRRVNSVAPRCWIDEFSDMNLPTFSEQYLQLTRVPLDMMQECMRLKTELTKSHNPTPYSVGKLVQEFHITLKKAVEVRKFYRRRVHLLIANNPGGLDLVDADMACYEKHLLEVLQLYFTYVENLVQVSATDRNLLEMEWERAKDICNDISNGEIEAGLRFCHMASQLIENLEETLKSQIDRCCDNLHDCSNRLDDADEQKQAFTESCREFKSIIQDAREASMKGLGFSKTLMTDLEIAAEFHIACNREQLLRALVSSDHCQVIIAQYQSCMLFVPYTIADSPIEIQQLLGVSFGRPVNGTGAATHNRHSLELHDNYLLVVKFNPGDSLPSWTGKSVNLTLSAETIVSISEMQVEGIKLIVRDSSHLDQNQMSFLRCMGTNVEISNKRTSSHHSVAERIEDLKHVLCHLGHSIMEIVERINENLALEEVSEREDLLQQYQPTMHTCYNLGFEYIQDLSRLFGNEFIHQKLGVEMLHFAQQWMVFVTTKCPRGYGKRPRWAVLGLDFILLACSPRMLSTISHTRYENVKKQMERCLEHVIGEAPLHKKGMVSPTSGWTKPTRHKKRSTPFQRGQSLMQSPLIEEKPEDALDGDSSGIDSPVLSGELPLDAGSSMYTSVTPRTPPNYMEIPKLESLESVAFYSSPALGQTPSQESLRLVHEEGQKIRTKQIQEQCKLLDRRRDACLRENRIIGQVTQRSGPSVVEFGKLTDIKQSHFTWRRGRKLGEGQFGVVYECINLDQGEVQAVKMISLKEKSTSTVRDILSEIKVFRTIRHENIVHLHGVEIHDTDLYLFMEYCNQGTLWGAAKQGLEERMIRLYTRDLLKAVYALHEKGIIHRDIKGANIFLSDDSVKLGDFGLSVQLQNVNKTAPQEIKHQRGTIPYMSPEVVLKQDMGRPMDIWGIGCVVVEMCTSKRPWIEFEDNAFAIMYQLGQGKHPNYPTERMNDEMIEFLDMCFQSEPKERADVNSLLNHPFVEILDQDDS